MAPLDRCPQRLVPGHAAAAGDGQHAEAGVEQVGQLDQRQGAQPDRGQLDRERYAAEPPAQPDDVRAVRRGDGESRRRRGGALREQLDGVALDRQRRHREGVLARRVERLPAGREHGHLGRGPQHRLGQSGAGVDQMLAGVEDQQHPPVPHVLEHGRPLQAGVPWRQPEAGRDRAGEQRRVGHPGQLDQHDAVGEPARRQRGRGDVQAEPALPDPARADHGDQPGRPQQGRKALRLDRKSVV